MTQVIEILFTFLVVIFTNNVFIRVNDRKMFSPKFFVINLISLLVFIAVLSQQLTLLQVVITILFFSSLVVVCTQAESGFVIALFFQILGITLLDNVVLGTKLNELSQMQSSVLWKEIPSWLVIFQPYAFALFILSAVLYSKTPFLKTLIVWFVVYTFLGGSYLRGFETFGPWVVVIKTAALVLFVNIVESLGFNELKSIEKLNNKPIMILWVLNIINNVFGIFKI